MARFKLTLEIIEDDPSDFSIRRMEETRDLLPDDCCDGEQTVGLLLSLVPCWVAAETGCSGIATVCHMLKYLRHESEGFELFRKIGEAYDKWGAAHGFEEGVKVEVDSSINECGECECSGHGGPVASESGE